MTPNKQQVPALTLGEIFNEKKLRQEIAERWGEFGAHIEVYDMLIRKCMTLDLLITGKFVDPQKVKEAEIIAKKTKP